MAWDRNSAHYPRAVAQFDQTACWAAGLEWWLRCMTQTPRRTVINQMDLINRFVRFWDSSNPDTNPNYGTVTGENLGHIMDDGAINMSYVVRGSGRWDNAFIAEKLVISPVLLGYLEPEVNGFHVNIIHSLNDGVTADVNVMDPNRGRYRTRNHNRLMTGNYVLGWAN
jgi:hypothetical protein